METLKQSGCLPPDLCCKAKKITDERNAKTHNKWRESIIAESVLTQLNLMVEIIAYYFIVPEDIQSFIEEKQLGF